MKTYQQLRELQSCIREFREIYERKSMPLLYIFIDRYKRHAGMKELSRFASRFAERPQSGASGHKPSVPAHGRSGWLHLLQRSP